MSNKQTLVLLVVLLAISATQAVDARPKRSVYLAGAPAVAVASVPVVAAPASTVVHSQVVHQPTSVVRTEQVRSGNHASYSYSHEVKSQPVVPTHTVAAAPVVSSAVVAAPVHHTVPTAYYAGTHYAYPSYSSYGHYYSPYSYVIGK